MPKINWMARMIAATTGCVLSLLASSWCRFRRYGSLFRLKLLGLDVNVVTDWSVLRQLLSRAEGASMEVPFSAFELLMEDLANMQDNRVHKYWVSVPPVWANECVPHR